MNSSFSLTKTIVPSGIPVFIQSDSIMPGGFTLNVTGLSFTPGASTNGIIPAGTPLFYNEANRLATPVLGAKLYTAAGATDSTYNVYKGHNLVVGMNLTTKTGAAAYPITAINTSNAAYDAITLSTTLGVALPLYDGITTLVQPVLVQSSAAGAAAGAYKINSLLFKDTVIDSGMFVSALVEGIVYGRRTVLPIDIASFVPQMLVSQSL